MLMFLIHVFGFLAAAIPQFCAEKIARFLGRAFFFVARSRRRIMLGNLHHLLPEKTEKERHAIAVESACRMVEMGMFVLASPHFSKERILKSYRAEAGSRIELLERGKPIVVAVPHFSQMESLTMLPLFFEKLAGRDNGVFYRQFKNPAIESWVKRTRQRFGFTLLSRKLGLTQAISFLNSCGTISVLFDQSPGEHRGVLSLFANRVTTSSALAGTLVADRPNAILATCHCERTGFWKGTVKVSEITLGDLPRTAANYTIAINSWLEGKLRENANICADWLWAHDRWRPFNDSLNYAHRKNILPETLAALGLKKLPKEMRIWIRMPNWLGDVVMALPLVKTIRRARPDAQITLLAQKHFVPMLERLGVAERIIALPPKTRGYWKFFRQLRFEYPDQIFIFTNSLRGDLEAKLAGIPIRAGIVRDKKPRPLLTHKWFVPADLNLAETHQTRLWERWLRRRHGLTAPLDFAPIKLAQQKENRIGLICGSENSPEKRWSVARWREFVAIVSKKFPTLEIFLFGTKKDAEITAEVARGNDKAAGGNVVDRAGKTDLPTYMDELASCRAICGNDTGGLHLANMLGVPVVGIFGPTNPVRTGPIFKAPIKILQPEGCPKTGGMDIDKIPAEKAASTLAEILAPTSPKK